MGTPFVKVMLKKEIKAVWDRCIKRRSVLPEERKVILNHLKTVPYYAKMASKPEVSLKVQYKNFGRFSAWVIVMDNFLPITKKKAFPTKTNPKTELLKALRNDINHQILYFRGSTKFPQTCYLSGKTLKAWSETDIDHVYPLSKLADDWMEENGFKMKDLKIKGRANARTLADDLHRKSWQEYHFSHADLKCTSKRDNRKKGSKIIN